MRGLTPTFYRPDIPHIPPPYSLHTPSQRGEERGDVWGLVWGLFQDQVQVQELSPIISMLRVLSYWGKRGKKKYKNSLPGLWLADPASFLSSSASLGISILPGVPLVVVEGISRNRSFSYPVFERAREGQERKRYGVV